MAAVAEAGPQSRRFRDLLEDRRFLAPALISPAALFIVLLVGVPLVLAVYLSMTDATAGQLTGKFVWFHNFTDAWHNDNFRKVVLNAILWIAKAQVPRNGVESTVTPEQLQQNLDPKKK